MVLESVASKQIFPRASSKAKLEDAIQSCEAEFAVWVPIVEILKCVIIDNPKTHLQKRVHRAHKLLVETRSRS